MFERQSGIHIFKVFVDVLSVIIYLEFLRFLNLSNYCKTEYKAIKVQPTNLKREIRCRYSLKFFAELVCFNTYRL